MPLILAVEPDERQASILSGVVMNQLRADLVLVDSKDAAVAAMARDLPDLVLLTSRLARADEKEIIGRLRVRDARVQTLAIPPLAGSEDQEEPDGGFLRSFRRKRQTDKPAACDPKAFAREIRTRLRRVERARALPPEPPATPAPRESLPPSPPRVDPWSWAARAPVPPAQTAPADSRAAQPAVPAPAAAIPAPARRRTATSAPPSKDPVPPPFFSGLAARYELIERAARGEEPSADEPASNDLIGIARGLRVPESVALFSYPRACRIEQVRVARQSSARHTQSFSMPPPATHALHAAAPA